MAYILLDAFSCPSGYFKCGTGKCLRESRVCDGNYDDCGDASDETNCSKCNINDIHHRVIKRVNEINFRLT